ncbi:MAG: hypothetical protein ACLFTI_04105 [Anaerolineales bacterium]
MRRRTYGIGLAVLGAMIGLWGLMTALTGAAQGAALPRDVAPAALVASPIEIDQTSPDVTFAGEIVTFTIVVTNTSTEDTLSEVTLQDSWTTKLAKPNDWWDRGILLEFEDYTVAPSGAVESFSHILDVENQRGEATWVLNDMTPGAVVEIELLARVPITLQPSLRGHEVGVEVGPANVENSVVAELEGYDDASSPLASSMVVGPLIEVEHWGKGEDVSEPSKESRVGRLVTYTIHFRNLSTGERPDAWPVGNIYAGEKLPTYLGASVLAVTSTVPADYIYESGAITWTFPSTYVLEPGTGVYLTFTARLPENIPYEGGEELENKKSQVTVGGDHVKAHPIRDATKLKILSPFDKVVMTPPVPEGETTAYPGQPVTYTLTFYNPNHNSSFEPVGLVDSLIITDTLYPTFILSEVVDGPPLAMNGGNYIVWEDLSVPANGQIEMTFVVTATPPVTATPLCGRKGDEFPNALHAVSDELLKIYPGHDDNKLALLSIAPEIEVSKEADPETQIIGDPVTYTVRVENVGLRDIAGPLVLTDTLPQERTNENLFFTFIQMITPTTGFTPTLYENDRIVVWEDLPGLAAGTYYTFAFQAEVNGIPGSRYDNEISMYSEETIMCPFKGARVTADTPFRINKLPLASSIVLGDWISYTAILRNVSSKNVYTVAGFYDLLDATENPFRDLYVKWTDPADGDNLYEHWPITYPLEPGESFSHTFIVSATGSGIHTDWCNALGPEGQEVPQAPGAVLFSVIDEGGQGNMDDLAEVMVLPHVSLLQEAYPNPVAIYETVLFTLTLRDNRTAPVTPVTGIDLAWTIPYGSRSGERFTLLSTSVMTSTPPEDAEPGVVYWDDLDIPLGDEFVITATVQAIGSMENYFSELQALAVDDPTICIPAAVNRVETEAGGTQLVRYHYPGEVVRGIEIQKEPDVNEAPPYNEVVYALQVENQTGAVVRNVVITDVLPEKWSYVDIVGDTPEPDTFAPSWVLAEIGPEESIDLSFKARTGPILGLHHNQVEVEAPINWGVSDKYTKNVAVEVVSGIGFYKEATPREVFTDSLVTYELNLYNGADYKLSNIVITDVLPSGFEFREMVAGQPPGIVPDSDPQILRWNISSDLNSGASLQLVFKAYVDADFYTAKYYNTAIVEAINQSTGNPIDVIDTGPTAPVYVTGKPNVSISKSAEPNTVIAGERVTYTLKLHNQTFDAYDLIVTDTLPVSFTLVTPAPSGVRTEWRDGRQLVIWDELSIEGDEELQLSLPVQVERAAYEGNYANTVQVQMGNVQLPVREGLARVWVTELPRLDAEVSHTDDTFWVNEGETLEYTIHYTNSSPAPADDTYTSTFQAIVLTATLAPEGDVNLTSDEWTDIGGGQYIRTIEGPLVAGETGTTSFFAVVANDVPDEELGVRSQVEIGYVVEANTVDATPQNNISVDFNLIVGRDPIAVNKHADPTTVKAGRLVTYTIGLQLSENIQSPYTVKLVDRLPPDFVFAAAMDPTSATTRTFGSPPFEQEEVVWPAIRLQPGVTKTVQFQARVLQIAPTGPAYNRVYVEEMAGRALPEHGNLAEVQVEGLRKLDVQISKTDGITTVVPGQWVTYTVYYTNAVPEQLQYRPGYKVESIIITDTFEPRNYVIGPDELDPPDLAWERLEQGAYRRIITGVLEPGESGSVAFPVRVDPTIPAVDAIVNRVEVGFTTDEEAIDVDLSSNDNFDNPDTNILSGVVGIQIGKVVEPAAVRAGEFVTYAITLINNDTQGYFLNITDTLPISVTFVEDLQARSPVTMMVGGHENVVWSAYRIFAGYSASLRFRARVSPWAEAGTLCNAVQVLRDPADGNEPIAQLPVEGLACLEVLPPPQVDVQVVKGDGVNWAEAGDILTYTIRYKAESDSDRQVFSSLTLIETVPPEVAEVLSQDWENIGSGQYRYIINDPAEIPSGKLTFVVRLENDLAEDTVVRNRVEIDYTTTERVEETHTANNSDVDETTIVRLGDGRVKTTKAASDQWLDAGDDLTYTITLLNTSSSESYEVTVIDTLPAGITSEGQQQITWDGITIEPEGSRELTFPASINRYAQTGWHTNTVQIEQDGESHPPVTPADGSVYVSALPVIDVQVSKDNGVDWVAGGDTLNYTIRYTNAVESDAPIAMIILTDTFMHPEVIQDVSSSWSGSDGVYKREVAPASPLQPGQWGEVSFQVTLVDSIPDDIDALDNQIEIGYRLVGGADSLEKKRSNNVDSDVDGVRRGGLSVSKNAKPSNIDAGQAVTYTLKLLNDSNAPLDGVRITDTLPADFTFASANIAPAEVTQSGDRQLIIWDGIDLPVGGEYAVTFRVTTDPALDPGEYCNTVQLPAGTPKQMACVEVKAKDPSMSHIYTHVAKQNGVDAVEPGQRLVYTITYANLSDSDLPIHNVVLTETIAPSEYITFTGGSVQSQTFMLSEWKEIAPGKYVFQLSDNGGTLDVGASGQVTFAVQLAESIPSTYREIVNRVDMGYTTDLVVIDNSPNRAVDRDPLPGDTEVYLPLILKQH